MSAVVFGQLVWVTEARLYWLKVPIPVEGPVKVDRVICCCVCGTFRSPLCLVVVGKGLGWYGTG